VQSKAIRRAIVGWSGDEDEKSEGFAIALTKVEVLMSLCRSIALLGSDNGEAVVPLYKVAEQAGSQQ
jgi:hypothetical protein